MTSALIILGVYTSAVRLAVSILALALAGVSCARVKPIERGKLASPSMTVGLGEDGFASAYRAKFVESKTGGGLPGSAPGGGCGCAQ
jgi:hypothetical protein